jgi:methyl-accepting chemotaxis protein
MTMTRRRGRSVAFVCTVYTALVIAAAMAVYGVYQYLNTPGTSALRLVLEHGSHVLAFGVLLYLSLSLVLYRNVVRPIRRLNVKLYAITKGDLAPVRVESRVFEVQEIAEVVNFLLRQIGRRAPDVPIG